MLCSRLCSFITPDESSLHFCQIHIYWLLTSWIASLQSVFQTPTWHRTEYLYPLSVFPSYPTDLHFTLHPPHFSKMHFFFKITIPAKCRVAPRWHDTKCTPAQYCFLTLSQLLCLTSILPFLQTLLPLSVFPTPPPRSPVSVCHCAFRGCASVTVEFLLHTQLRFHHVNPSDEKKWKGTALFTSACRSLVILCCGKHFWTKDF